MAVWYFPPVTVSPYRLTVLQIYRFINFQQIIVGGRREGVLAIAAVHGVLSLPWGDDLCPETAGQRLMKACHLLHPIQALSPTPTPTNCPLEQNTGAPRAEITIHALGILRGRKMTLKWWTLLCGLRTGVNTPIGT